MTLREELVLERDLSYLVYGGGASFVASILLYLYVSPAVSRLLTPSYTRLDKHRRAEWDDRFISNVNALVSIYFSWRSLLGEPGMLEDHVWYDSYTARLACGIVSGYMIADAVLMMVCCKPSKGELLGYFFHHAATVYAYSLISGYGVLCYFGMLRLIAEMSTLPVNQRWYYDVLEVPRSRPHVLLNGLLMLVTFFFFRMVVMPLYWVQIWQVSGTEAVRRIGHIQLIMYVPTFVLDVLNVYWFYKMTKGFIKAVKRAKTQTVDPAKDAKLKSV